MTPGTLTVARILHRRIVPASALAAAVLACSLAFSVGAFAQEERPQIMPSERRAPKKKDSGPRAVAVLRVAANGKTSLVPIAILIDNKFWDASAYKADPVPMALDSGTVYEGEQTGSSLGLFTVSSALHSNAVNSQAPWIGTGSWHPNGMEEPKKAQKTDNVPVGMNSEDQPPRLTHNPSATTPASTSAPSSGSSPSSTTQPGSDSKPGGSSGSGDEPPRLSKPASSPSSGAPNGGGAQTPPSSSAPSGSASPSTPSQGESKSKGSKAQPDNIPPSDSGANEENRPRLRRGRPAESFADEDVPGYSKPGATTAARPTAPAATGKVVQTAATEAEVKLIPAISDAAGPAPHSYGYEWVKGDEEDRRKQMTDFAKQRVRAYVAALERNRIPAKPAPKPAHPTAVHHAAQPEPILENVQMVAYDLWNSNQPIIVFSAEAHMPSPPASTSHSEVDSELEYSVMLVAYPDIYNNLHALYVGVTDKMHLDVTPRLELIDAVDADGDGRGELLFRQTSDQGTGWAIYRATGDKLWKMYDSLSPL